MVQVNWERGALIISGGWNLVDTENNDFLREVYVFTVVA